MDSFKYFLYMPSTTDIRWWRTYFDLTINLRGKIYVQTSPLSVGSREANFLEHIGFNRADYALVPIPLCITGMPSNACLNRLAAKVAGFGYAGWVVGTEWKEPDETWTGEDLRELIAEGLQSDRSIAIVILYLTIPVSVGYSAMDFALGWVDDEIFNLKRHCAIIDLSVMTNTYDFREWLSEQHVDAGRNIGWTGDDEEAIDDEESVSNASEDASDSSDVASDSDYESEHELVDMTREQRAAQLQHLQQNLKRKFAEAEEEEESVKRARRYSSNQAQKCAEYNKGCRYTPIDMEDWCEHPAAKYWGLQNEGKCFDITELLTHFEISCIGAKKNGNPFPRYPFDPWTNEPFEMSALREIAAAAALHGIFDEYPRFKLFMKFAADKGLDTAELTVNNRNELSDELRELRRTGQPPRNLPPDHPLFDEGNHVTFDELMRGAAGGSLRRELNNIVNPRRGSDRSIVFLPVERNAINDFLDIEGTLPIRYIATLNGRLEGTQVPTMLGPLVEAWWQNRNADVQRILRHVRNVRR